MGKNLISEIISIGTELLLGEIVDTNSTFLSERLRDRGIFVYRKTTIGDNLSRLVSVIKEALLRADIIILSGGLGPTDDDLTREAIAEVLDEKPYIDASRMERLKEKFANRKCIMPACNNKQAWLIKSAESLNNPVGTAPGWFVRFRDKIIVALPGPPSEMNKMWYEQVEPRLPQSEVTLYSKTIHTSGIGESDLAEKLLDFTTLQNPGIGTYARKSGVDVRIGASANSMQMAKKIVEPVLADIEKILSPWIYGYDDETIISVIMKLLNRKKQTFACMETNTGGMLASAITDCTEVSSCFKGSYIAYSNDLKIKAGVPKEIIDKYGTISKETTIALSQVAREMFSVDWALATTGACGNQSLDDASHGATWIAISGPDTLHTHFFVWPGSREVNRDRTCRIAFQIFFKLLKESYNKI